VEGIETHRDDETARNTMRWAKAKEEENEGMRRKTPDGTSDRGCSEEMTMEQDRRRRTRCDETGGGDQVGSREGKGKKRGGKGGNESMKAEKTEQKKRKPRTGFEYVPRVQVDPRSIRNRPIRREQHTTPTEKKREEKTKTKKRKECGSVSEAPKNPTKRTKERSDRERRTVPNHRRLIPSLRC
jgi:hypothetical protein